MLENVEVLFHSSIRISTGKIIYIDPYKIDRNYEDADIIFITHLHYDHYSEEDIDKVMKDNTIFVAPEDVARRLIDRNTNQENIIIVEPEEMYNIDEIQFETIPAYNTDKPFHPKENNWVGYVITINNIRYYIAGDTDITEENKGVECDIAFVPVGGTYTMTAEEAAKLVNEIMPKVAIPIHYGSVIGSREDAVTFLRLLNPKIHGEILMK